MTAVATPAWVARTAPWTRRSPAQGAHARPVPVVAILCTPARARVTASGIALALSRAVSGSCALAGVVGAPAAGSLAGAPAAGRAAAILRSRGLPARAHGRLVWLADRRAGEGPESDGAACAAAMSSELARAAAVAGIPAAIALPFSRSAALDRVLAWHDAIVIVREPDMSDAMHAQALASLAVLGRPVAAMSWPRRLPATLAVAGVQVPDEAMRALAALGLVRGPGVRDGA